MDIKPHDSKLLKALLSQYLPDTPVWAYGSRVTGGARPWSDLDLIVFTKTSQRSRLSALKEMLEESNLPFRVELFEWDMLPDHFKANIENQHIVIN